MSRRGNCHDNAVAESFFATFKKRVIQKKIYATREEAKGEIFNFIEMFYNPVNVTAILAACRRQSLKKPIFLG